MFQWMRNTHLALGLAFLLFALLFAASSFRLAYRDWFSGDPVTSERVVEIPQASAADARALARELILRHGIKGELRTVGKTDGRIEISVGRPGDLTDVVYSPESGQATLKRRQYDFWQTLVHLHLNYGTHHDFLPLQLWSALTLLTSLGLIALGGTGIYLWYSLRKERLVGSVFLVAGLVWGVGTLILCRV